MNSVRFGDRPISPSKIVCVGRNYVAHIEELGNEVPGEMVVFCKPNSAIGSELRAVHAGEPLHFEGEIALLYADGRFVAAGFGLDLTKRELQSSLKARGLPWERAKAFDGAALFSDFKPIGNNSNELALELNIDGRLCQAGDVSLMLYPPAQILQELDAFMTLEDGDIIMTGTPAGVGAVNAGARFEGRIMNGPELLTEHIWQAT